MSPTLQGIDPTLFADLKSGDEHAFERLFRDRYAALMAEAMPLLDSDGASAARGVETVFAHVWRQHEDFATPEALEEYLHAAVHEAAARIKSRHAVAHHLGEHDGSRAQKVTARPAPGVDEAWSKVHRSLHVDDAHAADVAHEAADHSRHEAAAHLAQLAKPRPRGPMIAVVLALVLAIGAITWWTSLDRGPAELTAALAAADARSVTSGPAEFSNVRLDDGSTVTLGPDSRLRIPRRFGGAIRGLQLEGAASFTVAPGQRRRFTVRAGNTTIVATGTEFTVRAYADERDVAVRVNEGEVTATVGDSVRTLATGAVLVVSNDGAMRVPAAAEVEQSLGWTDGTVLAADRPLREILPLAKRWFGLDLFVADTTLLDRRATLHAKIGSPDKAVASIATSGGLQRATEGSNTVLRDSVGKTKRPR